MTTVDRLNRGFDAAGDFPQLRDYRGALSAIPGYIGTWRADAGPLRSDVGGAIQELRDWDGTRRLVQTNASNRPTLAYDLELRRYVLRFERAASQWLTLTGTSFDPTGPWSIALLLKTDATLSGFQGIAGLMNSPPETQNAGIQLRNNLLTAAMNGIYLPARDATEFHRRWTTIIVSYNGDGGVFLDVNGMVSYNSSTPVSEPTGSAPLTMGSQYYPFGGYIDCMVAMNFGLHAASDQTPLATVRSYLATRLN